MRITMVVHLSVEVEDDIDANSLCLELPEDAVSVITTEGVYVGTVDEYETVSVLIDEDGEFD